MTLFLRNKFGKVTKTLKKLAYIAKQSLFFAI